MWHRNLGKLVLVLNTIFASPLAFSHGESRFEIELESEEHVKSGTSQFAFQIVDLEAKKTITDADLQVKHEKKLHLFLFDAALKEFRHLHPEYNATDKQWQVEGELSVNGNYRIWAQGILVTDDLEFTAGGQFDVVEGSAANPVEKLKEAKSGTDDVSGITLSYSKLKAKKAAMINLDFFRTDGTKPEITPYLGEKAHVVGVLSDGDVLVHMHPMEHKGKLMLHAEFPEAGTYRLWVQFIDKKVLHVVPLVVTVAN